MSEKENKEQRAAVGPSKVKYVNGPQYSSFYCNNLAFAVNAVDLVLFFGEIVDVEDDTAIVERRARVTFTPAQMRMLQVIVTEQIRQYELMAGPIVLPQGVQDAINNMVVEKRDIS